jgi:hypothetical protein
MKERPASVRVPAMKVESLIFQKQGEDTDEILTIAEER